MAISRSIEVRVPLTEAYQRWTQIETFPQVMDGIARVETLGRRRSRWQAAIAGIRREWVAEVVEAVSDEQIWWRSTEGVAHAGTVRFVPVDAHTTRIDVDIDWEPADVFELLGSLLGIIGSRVQGDLERFKEFVELRRVAPGEWRGEAIW